MNQLGYLVLLLAFVSALYGVVISILGARRNREDLIRSGERGALAVTGLLTLAVILLLHALLTRDFQNEYVASYSNRALPIGYTFTALWGGQKGSLLFWGWLLSLYCGLVIFIYGFTGRDVRAPQKEGIIAGRELLPYGVSVLLSVNAFFILLNLFLANPLTPPPYAHPLEPSGRYGE